MAKKQAIEVEANVTEALPNGMFRVTLPNEHQVFGRFVTVAMPSESVVAAKRPSSSVTRNGVRKSAFESSFLPAPRRYTREPESGSSSLSVTKTFCVVGSVRVR